MQRIAVGDWERSGRGERVKECEGAARKERAKREMREMAVATAVSLFISMFKEIEDRGRSPATDSPSTNGPHQTDRNRSQSRQQVFSPCISSISKHIVNVMRGWGSKVSVCAHRSLAVGWVAGW